MFQISFGSALPATSSKNAIYDFVLEKSLSIKSREALLFALSHSKLFKYSLDYFESKKGDETFDTQYLADLQKEIIDFEASVETLKKDPNSCLIQHDVSNQISYLRTRTRDQLLDDIEEISHWRSQEKIDGKLQDEIFKTTIQELKDQLPEVVEKYKESLSETERQEFESALSGKANLYAALYDIYKAKKDATPIVAYGGDGYCDNFEFELVVAYLHRITI